MTSAAVAVLALLAQAPPGLRERIAELAKDPLSHREELVGLGPAAIRPLLDLNRPELEPVLFELKFSGSGDAGGKLRERLKASTVTFAARDLALPDALRLAAGIGGIPVFLDPDLQAGGAGRKITLDLQDASMKAMLDLVSLRSGLDYGWVRGQLVLSTPERLWPVTPEPPRPLGEAELKRLRDAVACLSADSIAERAEASLALEAAGEAALPHLEEAAREGDLDRRQRLRDAIQRIRRKGAPACFDRPMTLEGQELSAAGQAVVQALRGQTIEAIDLSEAPLSTVIPLVLSSCHVEATVGPAVAARKVGCVFDGQRAMDVLFFLTVPYGLDAAVKNGKVIVDTRAAIEAALHDR